MSHLGGGITSLLPRIRHYQDKAMWGVEDDPTHGRAPQRPFDDYLSRIYFDTGGFFGSPEGVQAALLHIPRSQLLPGTDYPQEIRSVGARELMEFLRGEGGAREWKRASRSRRLAAPTASATLRSMSGW